jgi:hypothetical protein
LKGERDLAKIIVTVPAQRPRAICHERSVMGTLTEDPETFFGFARNMLAHAALQAPAESDRFILTSGLAKIATGLEILSAEVKATRKELGDVKDMLQQMQQMQKRMPSSRP